MGALKNLLGKKFYKLTVIQRCLEPGYISPKKEAWWECLCDCGNTTIAKGVSLTRGITKSCGKCWKKHKYDIDECYFNEINSEHKAYILGFIVADGSVQNKKGGSLRIKISSKDKHHLETIKNCIVPDYVLRDKIDRYLYKGEPKYSSMCILNIESKIMIDALINKHKVLPNKTKVGCVISSHIPKDLMNHFVRGVFDGDGYVGICKNVIGFEIVGDYDFISNLQKVICDNSGLSINKLSNKGSVVRMGYGGRINACKFYNYIYQNATICLERKKDIFEKEVHK